MSFNGSGTFLINTAGQPVVSGTVISSTAFNALTADLATGLSTAITKDGQTTVTANIPMSTYKFTGLGVGSAATDSANLSQVQSTVTKLLNSVSGADTITATASPTLAAYAAGQMFYFVAAGDNTTSVTLNIDALGAKAVTRDGSTALVAADIKSGEVIVVVYDGTRFQVVSQLNSAGNATFANVSITSALNVGGVATLSGNLVFNSTSQRITADMSNGTVSNRFAFQTSTTNGNTQVNAIPNGTSTTAQFIAYNNADSNNASSIQMAALSSSTRLLAGQTGTGTYLPITFFTNGSEQARIETSGNFGIGTASPAVRLQVKSSAEAFRIEGTTVRGSGNIFASFHDPSGRKGYWGYGASDDNLYIANEMNAAMLFLTNAAVRATIDSSGNLGLGVTPSAFSSGYTALQFGGNPVIASQNNLALAGNAYYNSGWKYIASNFASRYDSNFNNGGIHAWFTAASGTAGNAISFTQAMTLDASGNLGIGTTTIGSRVTIGDPGTGLSFTNAASGNFNIGLLAGTGSAVAYVYQRANSDLLFGTNNTERARITSGGDLLVGTTTTTSGARFDVKGVDSTGSNYCVFFENSGSALLLAIQNDGRWRSGTAAASPYNFVVGATNRDLFVDNAGEIGYVSSVRASKTNIASVADTDWLLQLNPVTFNFRKKDAEGNYTDKADGPIKHGLIAEEVESVNPDLCFYDDEDKGGALRGVNYSHLITPMLKLLQKQQTAIATLEAKVTALESK